MYEEKEQNSSQRRSPTHASKYYWFPGRLGIFIQETSRIDKPISLDFSTLSNRLKTKFRNAGIRAGEMGRSVEEAVFLYKKIPRIARTSQEHISMFLADKDASHIKQHGKDFVDRKTGFNDLNSAKNLIWEKSNLNRRRGGQDMTELEIEGVNRSNSLESNQFLAANVLTSAFHGAFYSFLYDIPLAFLDEANKNASCVSITRLFRRLVDTCLIGGISCAFLQYVLSNTSEEIVSSEEFLFTLRLLGFTGSVMWLIALVSKTSEFLEKRKKRESNENILFTITI